jgi:hypothetical protein
MPAFRVKKNLGEETWNNYYKFCVVRNPFERCISAFAHFGKNHKIESNETSNNLFDLGMNPEQSRFYDYILNHIPLGRAQYVIRDKFCLDDVIRYETLELDIERVCEKLGLPFEVEYLPRFKSHNRNQNQTVEALYTDVTKKLVEDKFAFELEYFNYVFPQQDC